MTTVVHPPLNLFATIGDPDGTRTVTAIIALLVAIGVALAMVAVWLRRTTRPDPELLAPLEMMGERRWRRSDPVGQRRTLDEARPTGAAPLEPSSAPPSRDESFDAGPTAVGFDDLHGDAGDAAVSNAPDVMEPPRTPTSFAAPTGEVTPRQIDRPGIDDFADGFEQDIDPELLAAAAAELDVELGRSSTEE